MWRGLHFFFLFRVDVLSIGLAVGPGWCYGAEHTHWLRLRWGWAPGPWNLLKVYFPVDLSWRSCISTNAAQGLACRDFSECLPPCQAGFPRALLASMTSMTKLWDMETFEPLYAFFPPAHSLKKTLFGLVGRLLGKQWCNLFSPKLSEAFELSSLIFFFFFCSAGRCQKRRLRCVIACWQQSQSRVVISKARPFQGKMLTRGLSRPEGWRDPVGYQPQGFYARYNRVGRQRKWQPVQAPAVLWHKCSQSCHRYLNQDVPLVWISGMQVLYLLVCSSYQTVTWRGQELWLVHCRVPVA